MPAVAGRQRETIPDYPDAAYCDIPPNWVCEVLSPATRHLDQNEKRATYARERASHLWLVDPDAQTLEAFELLKGQRVLLKTLSDDAPVILPPFPSDYLPLGCALAVMK